MSWRRRLAVTGHSAPVYACIAHENFLYSSAGDRFVTRWNVLSGEQDAFAIRLDSPAYCLGWGGSLLLIGCTNGTIVAIDPETRTLVWEHNFLGKALFSCVDCPQEQFTVWGDAAGCLLVIDYAGNLLGTFHTECGKIRQLRQYGNELFAACQDGTIRVFELPTFNETRRWQAHEGGVTAFTRFPSDHTLLTGGKDAHLRLWDLLTGQELLALPAHYQTIYGIECLENGQFVTVSMDKMIKLWNPDTWKVEQRLEVKQGGHNRSVNGCFALKEGFVTFGDDKQILFWEMAR